MYYIERGFIVYIERFLMLEKKMIFIFFFLGNRCCEYIIGEGKYVLLKCS